MSRLRRAVQKYNELEHEEVELLDSSVQDDVILELKASLAKNRTPSSNFINIIIGVNVVLNLVLLTIPYYKKKLNGILSLLSILCSLVNYIVLKYEKYELNLGRLRLLVVSFILSLVILALKYNSLKTPDAVYAVPLLNCIGLYILLTDNDDLDTQILKLEKLKYDYKEA